MAGKCKHAAAVLLLIRATGAREGAGAGAGAGARAEATGQREGAAAGITAAAGAATRRADVSEQWPFSC